jgi:hypothetical protein
LGEALKRTLKASAPIHERELQLTRASSHASGDHCVPIGQGFQLKGVPDLQAYVVTSTNRCETLGVYIVPDASFESIQPALEGLGGRSTFEAAAYTVDDAHQSRERTLLALNKRKLEGLAVKLELPAISKLLRVQPSTPPPALGSAPPTSDGKPDPWVFLLIGDSMQHLLSHSSLPLSCCQGLEDALQRPDAKLVRELLQDLKHFSSRLISTLSVGPTNKKEFYALVDRIKCIFRTYDPVRDAEIDAKLVSPGGIAAGGRVMMRKAIKGVGGRRAISKIWAEDDFIFMTEQERLAAGGEWSVEAMKADGAWYKTFEPNRKKLNHSHLHMLKALERLEAELLDETADAYVAWSKPKGEGGRPVYTASKSTVDALRECIKKVQYVGSKTDLARSRPGPPDGRGLITEISLEGTNLTEAENASLERTLSAPGGYEPSYAHALLMDKVSADNTSARIKHEGPDGRKEPDLHHRNMELVRAHNLLNDYFGQPRQHRHHRDLPADSGETFGLTYYHSLMALRVGAAGGTTAVDHNQVASPVPTHPCPIESQVLALEFRTHVLRGVATQGMLHWTCVCIPLPFVTNLLSS